MTGVELIAAERQRQIDEEGYDAEHDRDGADNLAAAGAIYATPAGRRHLRSPGNLVPVGWPWADRAWKPTPDDRIRELTKAGALIAAAIDALLLETRPCPGCGAPLHESETHWSLFPEPMGGYVCPIAAVEHRS